jgi:O-antigen ligase
VKIVAINHTYIVAGLLISILIGAFVSIFTASVPIGLLLIGLIFLPIFIYKYFTNLGTLSLFLLFSTFGLMNTALKPFDVLFVVIAGFFFVFKKRKLQSLRDIRFINFALFLFMTVSLQSLISSDDIKLGTSYFIHTFFMIVIYYFLVLTIQTKKEFHSILLGYILTVLVSAVAVMIQRLGLIGDIGTWFQGVRAQGFFMDPNDFSPFLILAIILIIERAFSYHYFSFRYFTFIALAGMIIVVLLAGMSRAALLDFAIVIVIYLFYSLLYKKKLGQIGVLAIIMALGVTISMVIAGDAIIQSIAIRFSGSTEILQSYDTDRFYYQQQGIILGSTHLFGIGPGQFEHLFNYATHNLFVRIIAENGWIAFLSFMSMIVYLFVLLFHFRKKEVWNLPIYLFLSVYIGMLVNSFFLDTFHWRYFWFFLGLCTIIINQAARKE